MSYSRDFFGTTHQIPTIREARWGNSVTELLVALCDRMTGTPQQITADTATTDIDAVQGHNIALSLGAATTIAVLNMLDGDRLVIRFAQTGSFTVAWSDTIRWRGGVAPVITTGAGAIDIITIYMDPDYGLIGDYGQGYAVP